LRHCKVRRIQNTPRQDNFIVSILEFLNKLSKNLGMLPYGNPFYVLKHKVRSVQLYYESDEIFNERIAGVVEYSLANETKALAWRAAEHNVNVPVSNAGGLSNFIPCEV